MLRLTYKHVLMPKLTYKHVLMLDDYMNADVWYIGVNDDGVLEIEAVV